jgi:hypothetical protein
MQELFLSATPSAGLSFEIGPLTAYGAKEKAGKMPCPPCEPIENAISN